MRKNEPKKQTIKKSPQKTQTKKQDKVEEEM
jgi:hypothetical protein